MLWCRRGEEQKCDTAAVVACRDDKQDKMAVALVSTPLAYVIFLRYILHLNQAQEEPKELSLSEMLATLIQDKGVTKSTEVGGIAEKASQDIKQYPQERVYRVDTIRDDVVVGDIDQS